MPRKPRRSRAYLAQRKRLRAAIARAVRGGLLVSEAAAKFGVLKHYVYTACRRTA